MVQAVNDVGLRLQDLAHRLSQEVQNYLLKFVHS